VRSSLQGQRDREQDRPVTALEYQRNKRDRDAIFAALRTHLLRPGTPAKAVVSLLRRHFLEAPAFTISNLSQSERAILIEILHRVLHEWSQWKRASSSSYVSPARLIEFYSQYGILEPQDWAFCLNYLAWTAHEAFCSDLDEGIDQRLQRNVDTFLLLRALLKTWKLFFYCHSRERHDTYEVLNTDHPGLWPLLGHRSLPTALGDYSSKFNLRLLCFAPGWSSDGESFADQQLICASMVSIAALFQSIETTTSISILLPSTVINWEMSTITTSKTTVDKHSAADSAQPPQTALGSENAPSGLTSDELSMLFIVGQALNSQNINLTMLRVSLAKIVPENRIGQIMTVFSQFRSRVPGLLGPAKLDQQYTVDFHALDLATHRVPRPRLTEPVRRDPVYALVEKVNASQTISEVQSLTQVSSSLRRRNPRLKLREFEIAVYKKYLGLATPDQEREVWNASPAIHSNKKLLASRLDFYFGRNDITGFEDVWARLIARKYAISAADWCKRLQLYFNCAFLGAALDHFDALLKSSGRSQHDDPSTVRSRVRESVTIDTFNVMIKNLLQYDKLSWAIAIKQRLDWQQDIKANDTTYDLFFSYYIDRGKAKPAIRYLRALARVSPPTEFAPYFKLVRHGLQQWPRTAQWADVHLVMEVFDRVLGDKHFKSKVLRRISLISQTIGQSFNIKVLPIPESDTLDLETRSGTADRLTAKVPVRTVPLSPAAEALRTDLLSLMSALAEEYPNPKNARMMLILWTYCVLQGLPQVQEIEKCLKTTLFQVPFRQQLRILGGDIYKRLSHLKYGNFAYIRNHFGPDFAIRRLEGLGLGGYASLIRNLPWRGFTTYNDQLLLEVGVTSERARSLFLDDMSSLYHDLKVIRKQEKSQCQRRMVTKEGIWYLRNESVDKSGSLRKIPFEYWETESKRQATERFKLAAAAPKLLGGEGALRRLKQRMLLKGRKALTNARRGLVFRPFREPMVRRRRARKMRMILEWRHIFRHRVRNSARLGGGLRSIQKSQLQVQDLPDMPRQHSKKDAIRELPPKNKSVLLPASNFRTLINPDAEKAAERGQPKAQQLRFSSDVISD
jgi:hypothetical protein